MDNKLKIVLLISCPDAEGIVSEVAGYISGRHGNILHLDEHVDKSENRFFMRVEWESRYQDPDKAELQRQIQNSLAAKYDMEFALFLSTEKPSLALFVSKVPHCLNDILARVDQGEWKVEIPIIISNHPDLRYIAKRYGIDFKVFPMTPENKLEQERHQLNLLKAMDINFIALARYMQVLSPQMVEAYPNQIINIHHSFLPAFSGGKPYHSAHQRGVKIIGATSHFATEDLDEGPIITQDVIQVSHADEVADLVRKGRDIERVVLARAIWSYLQRKIIVYKNKTVVF